MTSKMIFISHSTKDDAQIDHISESLTKAGHGVWVDHRNGITPGTPSWDKAIRDAIKNADVGVFVMSEHALESDICGSECLLIRELNKPLYVLRLTVCKPENIFLYIKQIQYADLVTDFEAGMQTFLDVLGGGIAQNLPTPSRAKITGGETMRQYLPFLNNPLRGRDDDLATIQTMLTQAGITQIIGVGGWGKSRISAEIALAYPQGAVWHRCSSVSSAGDLLYTLRRHFDLPDDIPQDNILVLLDTHRPLVVIDNAEDVAPKSDRRAGYVDLLGKIAGLGVPVLLTSRIVWDELKPRKQYPPPALNGDIAQTITADFAESQNISLTPNQIAELTRASRNHPRLMELAVALLQEALPYERLIKRLNDLSHDDMQDALNEMILKTVDQMRHEAKHGETAYALLRNLTWLQATFPYEAIQALAPAGLSDDDLDDAITTLGRYTFLQHDKNTGRYRLGGLVREALGVNDDEAVFNAYADYYIGRAKAIFVYLEDKPELWNEFSGDIVNIMTLGNELIIQTQNGTTGDLGKAVLFAYTVRSFVALRIEMRLWKWLEMGLNATSILRENSLQIKALDKQEADILRELGNIHILLGENHTALTLLEHALSFYRAVADKISENTTLRLIGNVWYTLGNKQHALSFFEQALSLSRAIGDKKGEAKSLNNIGLVLFDLGETEKALNYYDSVLSMLNMQGDKRGAGATLNNIGLLLSAKQDNHKALEYYEKALELRQLVGDKAGEATTLNNIGKSWIYLGDKRHALTYCEEAIALSRLVGDKTNEARTLINLGDIWADLDDFTQAFTYYEQALQLNRLIGDISSEATTLSNMSKHFYRQNNLDKAIEYQERAIATTYTGDPRLPEWQQELARLKALRGGGA